MKKYDDCIKECQKALDKRYETRADFERVAKVGCVGFVILSYEVVIRRF